MKTNWEVIKLHHRSSDGFVVTAYWEATANEGDFSASTSGTVTFTGEPVINYENITKELALNWIWKSGIRKDDVEESLIKQINAKKNPIISVGLPWN